MQNVIRFMVFHCGVPMSEGVIRRKLSEFISPKGNVQKEFEVETLKGKNKIYKSGQRISNLYDEQQLLEKKTMIPFLKDKLSRMQKKL